MRPKKKILLSSLVSLSAIAVSTAIVVPLVVVSHNKPVSPITPEQLKIFNIKGDTVYGFNKDAKASEIQQYIDHNNGLVLPSVKEIAPNAFEQFTSKLGLNNAIPVPIPASIEVIGEHAFYNSDITALTFEKKAKCHTIGKSAFAFCHKLTSAQIPAGVVTTDTTKGIKARAFYCCDALATLDFVSATVIEPSGKGSVVAWADDAFIRLPDEGKLLFYTTTAEKSLHQAGVTWSRLLISGLNPKWVQCNSKGKAIANPWKPIPYEAFDFEPGLPTVWNQINSPYIEIWPDGTFNSSIIPKEITATHLVQGTSPTVFRQIFNRHKLFKHTFEYCELLETFESKILSHLDNYDEIPNIKLPPKLVTIGESAFSQSKVDVRGLNKAIGPKGTVKTIEQYAFCYTSGSTDTKKTDLINLTFNAGLTVGTHAFCDIANLKSINIVEMGKKPPDTDTWTDDCFKDIDGFTTSNKRVVHIKEDEKKNILEQWRIAQAWLPWFAKKGIVISDDDWSIQPKGSQLKYDDIFKVVDGECQGFIRGNDGKVPEWSEFEKLLEGKTTLTFPKTVTKIADNAFINDDGTSTIPNNLIEYIDFRKDSEGNPSKITSIGKNAFKNLTGTVKELWFDGSALKTIGESAFENGPFGRIIGLDEMTSVTTIGKRAFYACRKISKFSKDDTKEGNLLLDQMTGLTTIGDDAFARWDDMWKATGDGAILRLNKQLTSIGRGAFYGNRFNVIEIPKFNGEITIGNNAFAKDTTEDKYQLKQINITEYTDVPTWKINDYAYLFAGVGSSGKITVSSDTLLLRLDKIWNYFAGQSEEIKRNPDTWICERAQ